MPKMNLVKGTAHTIDWVTDSVAGVKIAGPLVDTVEQFAPANVIEDLTGMPKPSEVMEDMRYRALESMGLKGKWEE